MNALATYEPQARYLSAVPFERALTSDDLLAYLRDRLPPAEVPRVVVLNSAGIHTGTVAKAARPGLAKRGTYLYHLPPYGPELNRIEPVFKQAKHHEMPIRSFTTRADLRKTVEDGFDASKPNVTTNPAGRVYAGRQGGAVGRAEGKDRGDRRHAPRSRLAVEARQAVKTLWASERSNWPAPMASRW